MVSGEESLRRFQHLSSYIQYLYRLRHLRAGHRGHLAQIRHFYGNCSVRHNHARHGLRHRTRVPFAALGNAPARTHGRVDGRLRYIYGRI